MQFNTWDFSQKILDFLEHLDGEATIDQVSDFYKRHIVEPSDITEKELFTFYLEPLRNLKRKMVFHPSALHFHAYAQSRYVENDFDYVGLRCGTEGKGKSTFALNEAEDLKWLGIPYKMEDILFRGSTVDEALKVISETRKGLVWIDEAKAFFDKRQSLNFEQVELIQEITAQRKNNNIYALCIGDVDEVDKYFRERRAREVVIIPDRKIFIVLLNMGIVGMGQDRFRLDYLDWIISQQKKLSYTAQISALANLPSAYAVGHFGRANNELFAEYKEVKEEKNSYARFIQKQKLMKRKKQNYRENAKFGLGAYGAE